MVLSGSLPSIPEGSTLKVWPATLTADSALAIEGSPAGPGAPSDPTDTIATFRGLSFEALTAFFAFEVSLRDGEHEARRRFAVTAVLRGAPKDRKERLLRSLLSDRRRVLQLLFLILMDEGADVSAFVEAAQPVIRLAQASRSQAGTTQPCSRRCCGVSAASRGGSTTRRG